MTSTSTPALTFGARVLVRATVARYIRPGDGTVYRLHDRRDPFRSRIPDGPDDGWPGQPIPAPDGYDLEPEPGKGAVRLRRLGPIAITGGAVVPPPEEGVVVGLCTRYEGDYQAPQPYYADAYDTEPGALINRRPVRLVEVALPPFRPTDPARLVLAWQEDLTHPKPGGRR